MASSLLDAALLPAILAECSETGGIVSHPPNDCSRYNELPCTSRFPRRMNGPPPSTLRKGSWLRGDFGADRSAAGALVCP